jgi:hypothetical protein
VTPILLDSDCRGLGLEGRRQRLELGFQGCRGVVAGPDVEEVRRWWPGPAVRRWAGCRRRMGGGAGGRGRRKKLDMRRGSGVVARYTGPPLSEISVSGRFPGSTEYRY